MCVVWVKKMVLWILVIGNVIRLDPVTNSIEVLGHRVMG